MHAHMNWHAHSNPIPSHSCPSDANKRSRAVGVTTKHKLATALTQRLLSNVTVVIGNFNKMLKPSEAQDKYPFFV